MKTIHNARSKFVSSVTVRRSVRAAFAAATIASAAASAFAQPDNSFIPILVNSSTIPLNGDVNPYGVAFVPGGFPSGGMIQAGDVLVSNFNNSGNLQGEGTTIIKLTPTGPIAAPGAAVTFFASSRPGLSTALGVLRAGYVIVGNVPTTDGTFATIGQGALQVLNANGSVVATWTDATTLDGPWDLAIDDRGSSAHVFVANVLNGSVSRLDISVASSGVNVLKKTTIATGYAHMPNAAALILGPTGLAYDALSGTLFVASTVDNAIYSISDAEGRTTSVVKGNAVFSGSELRGPLALRFAPNGNLLAANGDAVNADVLFPSEIVEFTRQGKFIRQYNVDAGQGGAFGLDTVLGFGFLPSYNYAAIDDVTNSLSVYKLPTF